MSELLDRKDTAGKPDWSRLFAELPPDPQAAEALLGLARALEYGRHKYSSHTWRNAAPGEWRARYASASIRHAAAIARGEDIDPESGLPHADHMLATAFILGDLRLRDAISGQREEAARRERIEAFKARMRAAREADRRAYIELNAPPLPPDVVQELEAWFTEEFADRDSPFRGKRFILAPPPPLTEQEIREGIEWVEGLAAPEEADHDPQ